MARRGQETCIDAVPQPRRCPQPPCLVRLSSHPWTMSRLHMRGVDLVMSLPCLWQLGGGVLVASHNEFDDLSDLDETPATGRVPLTRVVAGRLHAARGRPAEEQWAWRRRGGKKAGKKDERGGHPVCPTSDGCQGRDAASIPLSKRRLGATAWPLGRPCCHPPKCLSR